MLTLPTTDSPLQLEPAAALIGIVEESPSARRALERQLESLQHRTIVHGSVDALLASQADLLSLVCVSVAHDGLEVVERIRARHPRLPIVVLTTGPSVEWVVQAMRHGASDCFSKPLDPIRFNAVINRLLASSTRSAPPPAAPQETTPIIGDSAMMREVHRHIERIADKDVVVCLRGETGTGKELITRSIHERSKRRAGPFVAINCAAIPAQLQESEFFGHERGAFTGAISAHRGRFEQAHKGTLFLDELGEMSLETQAMLLRVFEERKVRRLGSTVEIPIDVRIICATHRDLEAEVAAGRFREDLYFRLVVYRIDLPPLRKRKEDLPALLSHFLHRATQKGMAAPRLSSAALEVLRAHSWPGNIRELQNVVTRAVLATDTDEIGVAHLPAALVRGVDRELVENDSVEELVPFREIERRAIVRAMRLSGGSVEKAAKVLELSRATVYRRLLEFATTPAGESSD